MADYTAQCTYDGVYGIILEMECAEKLHRAINYIK